MSGVSSALVVSDEMVVEHVLFRSASNLRGRLGVGSTSSLVLLKDKETPRVREEQRLEPAKLNPAEVSRRCLSS